MTDRAGRGKLMPEPEKRFLTEPCEELMTELTRQQYLDNLENDWGTYVDRFRQLSPDAQQAFVARQGFARFADLLAHVGAWWRDGISTLRVMAGDPDHVPAEMDVDSFNARAVARFIAFDEAVVIRFFEDIRAAFVELVTTLPDSAIADPRINHRLYIELNEHFDEHKVPDPAA
jgi:hypothetical protein